MLTTLIIFLDLLTKNESAIRQPQQILRDDKKNIKK